MNAGSLTFLLGTHQQPGWLHANTYPLFVSDRRLRDYRRLPVAAGPWALDSGGFTELQKYGSWEHGPTPREYVAQVRRYRDEVGRLMWAAPQDWMCEPIIINGGQVGPVRFAGTGLSVAEHQRHTVDNYVQLRSLAPELPFIPVLQGFQVDQYMRCVDLYANAGVDLTAEPLVGLGSVCRRQATGEAAHIVGELRRAGITRLHGFGVKTSGLLRYGHQLTSADSLAWSYDARRKPALPGCEEQHRNCANCRTYANGWRARLLAKLTAAVVQPDLWETAS